MKDIELPYEPLLDKGRGAPIVLLHGLFGNINYWKGVTSGFSNTHRILIPRLPLWSDPLSTGRLDDLVDYLHDFLAGKSISSSITLIGHSIGGHVALLYAIRYPDQINKIILTGSSSLFENAFGSMPPFSCSSYSISQKIQSAKSNIETEVSVAEVLSELDVSTLLIWGSQDTVTPPQAAQEYHEHLPKSKVIFINECGHVPMMEQWELFNYHLRIFLSM